MSTVVDLATLRPVIGAEPTPAELLADARSEAAQIVAAARAEAARLLADAAAGVEQARAAETAAEGRRAQHERRALRVKEVADAEASGAVDLVNSARTQAAELLDQAHALAGRRRTDAETAYAKALELAEEVRSLARDRADALLRAANEKVALADAAVKAAEADIDVTRRRATIELDEELTARRRAAETQAEEARRAADQARGELQAELTAMSEQFDREQQDQRGQEAAELAARREAAEKDAAAVKAAAVKAAAEIRQNAEKESARLIADAQRKQLAAAGLLEQAEDREQRAAWWRGGTDRAWKAAPWVALAAAIGLAASGEYELARMVGIHEAVAPLLPVSIDIYAITAFRARKDVRPALSIMAATNLAYHLAERSGVGDPGGDHRAILFLTAFVVLVFVAIVWRVHSLLGDHEHQPVKDAPPPGKGQSQGRRQGQPQGRRKDSPKDTAKDRSKDRGSPSLAHLSDDELLDRLAALDALPSVRSTASLFGISKDRATNLLHAAKNPQQLTPTGRTPR
ncbi:coiled-coil domain-containing protein [Streptomyces violascens]|uniref:hypothetical protein n=1 Tax=Streptomyces violascens TaxID=67381 RepID=UPI00368C6CD4